MMHGRRSVQLLALVVLAQWFGEAAEVYEMRDVRTCRGFEKSYAKCDDLPPCTKPCEQQDCVFAAWEEWYDGEGCSGLCYRHRNIQTSNNECGTPCIGPQIESKGCPKKECLLESQDCALSVWSDWSACNSAVDQRFRSRSLLSAPKGLGEPCLANLNETSPCDERRPVDCELSEWGQWTACSASCDGGYRAAMRKVLQHAEQGGRPCDGTLRKTEPCGQASCAGRSQDCELGEWSEWQGCDFTSPQQRYRSREVAAPALGSGRPCGEALKETRGCEAEAPEDCTFSDWSAWGQCDKSCGGGQTYRKRLLASEPKHGGSCARLANLTETASCNLEPCYAPTVCTIAPWSEWSSCSASCDVGIRERSREMLRGEARRLSLLDVFADGLVKAQASTVDCSGGFSGSLKEVAPCVAQSCPRQNCVWGTWAEWSDCTCSCGGGSRERSRIVQTPPGVGGLPCDPEDMREIGVCNVQACEACVNGSWGFWSEWSSCSASCGAGYRSRHRDVAQHPNDCGKPVEGVEDDFAACEADVPCEPDVDCGLSEWTAWTSCSDECFGVSERHRRVVSFPSGKGKGCEAEALKEVEMCNPTKGESAPLNCEGARAPTACQLSVWGDWGACSATCGGGQKTRLRHVLSPAAENGQLCNGSLSELRPCSEQACLQAACLDCRYGDWGEWGSCSKCGGQRYRHRSIVQMPNECGQACAVEDTKQTGECTSECEEEHWCAWTEWTNYGECSAECGPATRSRQRVLAIHKEQPAEHLFSGFGGMTCEGMQLDSAACEFKSCTRECQPVNCDMGEWTEWSQPSCSQLCERTRVVRTASACGGEACSGALVETKECPMECQKSQDCELSTWEPWSECESPDSQKFRKRKILQDAVNGGKPCEGRLTETEFCSTPGLPVPCELSSWGAWSECTQSCLGGLKQRTRAVSVTAANGGAPCEGGLEELAVCNTGHCTADSKDCALSAWAEWSACGHDGQRWRSRKLDPSLGGGKVCQGSLHEIQECSQAVDCELSEWSEWDTCDKTCEGGQQLRHRQVVRNPNFGGKACLPSLMETRGCNEEPCHRVDCEVGEWSEWGVCSASCGLGQRLRERRILQQPRNGGLGCGLELSQLDACSSAECEYVDCLWSDWADWSDCSSPCGGGQRTRTRRVERPPQRGGKPCVPLSKEEVGVCNEQTCADQACVDGAWGDWEEWSACSSSCKGGVSWRSRPVDVEANHCGKPATGSARIYASCNEDVPCEEAVDCVFGEWAAWSDCTGTCNGVKRRSREIAVQGRGEGKFCMGPMKETSPCNPGPGEVTPQACQGPPPVDCQLESWAAWSACSASCGGGSQMRERQVLTPPAHGGAQCEDVLAEVQGCARAPCSADCEPQDCAWEDWGEWSACDKCGGERRRFRHVRTEPSCGGAACEALASEETSNCTRQCHEPVYCMWGDWKEWSACSATCGTGEKLRMRHLELATAEQKMRFLKDFDISEGVDESLLQDSIGSLEEHTRGLRVRRVQRLCAAFSGGGLSLVAGLAVMRALGRRGRPATFERLPGDGQE